jgi:hypothetical protein
LLSGVSWFEIDVSGLPLGPIFKGEAVQEGEKNLTLGNMESVCSSETSVLNHVTPRKNPEDGRIQMHIAQ